ncbi:MAG: hypothetical protein KAW02_00960 [candidate division Zixibacteria bacterium]|nr:hypothetical protein [candidate division Zixibacteria bacterium]
MDYLLLLLVLLIAGFVVYTFRDEVKEAFTGERDDIPPDFDLVCNYDSSLQANQLIFKAVDEDLRILYVKGEKRERHGYVTLKKGSQLPANGLVRSGDSVTISIEDSLVQRRDLHGFFVIFTGPSERPCTSRTVEAHYPVPERTPEETSEQTTKPQKYCAFCPTIEVGDSLRIIITRRAGGKKVLGVVLRRDDVEESPKLLIRKEWIKAGYCIETIPSNGVRSDPQSLSGLNLEEVN